MQITIPVPALVMLVGPAGAATAIFAQSHFRPDEIVAAEADAAHDVVQKRLAAGLLTVIDAAGLQPTDRRPFLALAREHNVPPVAIGFGLSAQRGSDQRPSQSGLRHEGFRQIHIFRTPQQAQAASIVRQPLPPDRRAERGPFDIIGDVHGCAEELRDLLGRLGYAEAADSWQHPARRRAIFLGDLVDRGPDTPGVLRIVMAMVEAGQAFCVAGNHDMKLLRKLRGHNVQVAHGLAESLAQLEREPPAFVARAADFLEGLASHYVLDDGRLVVAHAGMKQHYQGRDSPRVRNFALYGETTGEIDELGLPVRLDWAARYNGPAMVVYGHTPVAEPKWQNRTINIDTGCVFGGRLTALRYPEGDLVSVPAQRAYARSARLPLSGDAEAAKDSA